MVDSGEDETGVNGNGYDQREQTDRQTDRQTETETEIERERKGWRGTKVRR